MNWTCRDCKKTIVGYKTEHCAEFHETFTRTKAGDMHRVGKHGVAEGPDRRRCLSPFEMKAKGMRTTNRGYWTTGEEFPDSL